MRAVAYARYSTENQRSETIDAQLWAIKNFAKEKGHSIIKEYSDHACTGTDNDRASFQQMLKDSKTKNFELVIVHKLDRFSRHAISGSIAEYELLNNGVKVVSVTEFFEDTPEGNLTKHHIKGVNQYYADSAKRESMKTLMFKASKNEFVGGRPPLGYDVTDKKYVINEFEAEAVKLIFKLFIKEHTYQQIIDALHKAGFRTKLGQPFKKTSIFEILNNEKYIGMYVFNKTPQRFNKKRLAKNKKKEQDIIRNPGGVPMIISEADFIKVQEIKGKRKRIKDRNRNDLRALEPYLFSGKVFCTFCGSKMHGQTRTNNNKNKNTYRYYACSTKGCPQHSIPKEALEATILKSLYGIFSSDEYIEYMADQMNRRIEQSHNNSKNIIKQLKEEIKKADKKIKNFLQAIAEGLDIEPVRDELIRVTEQKKSLELKFEKIQESKTSLQDDIKRMKKFIEALLDVLKQKDYDYQELKVSFAQLVERIDIEGDAYRLFPREPEDMFVNNGVEGGT